MTLLVHPLQGCLTPRAPLLGGVVVDSLLTIDKNEVWFPVFCVSMRVRRVICASRVLRNKAPSSVSAAEAASSFRIAHAIVMLPLNPTRGLFRGTLPRKNYPLTRLLNLLAVRYDASACTMIMYSGLSGVRSNDVEIIYICCHIVCILCTDY